MPVFTLVMVTVAPGIAAALSSCTIPAMVPPVWAWSIALERRIANTTTQVRFSNRMAALLYPVVSKSVLVIDDQTRQVRRAIPPHPLREERRHGRRVHDDELEPSWRSLRLGVDRESDLRRTHHLGRNRLALEMHHRPAHEVDALDGDGGRRRTLRHDVRIEFLNGGLR